MTLGRLKRMVLEKYGSPVTMRELEEFGEELARLVGREKPWTAKHLHSLIHEHVGFHPMPDFEQALALYPEPDRKWKREAKLRPVIVKANHTVKPMTIILGKARTCRLRSCRLRFVPRVPNQVFHSHACERKWRKK